MRVLWVKVGGLWPLTAGGRLRSFHIVRELSERCEVTVFTTHAEGEDAGELARQLPRCEVRSFLHAAPKVGSGGFGKALLRSWLSPLPVDLWRWRVPALREAVGRRREGADDVCVADFLTAVPNVPRGGARPVVLFEHNVEHLIWRRLAAIETRPWRRALLEVEWRKMRRAEAAACARVSLTLAVSAEDRERLAEMAPGARVAAIPTGVDVEYFHPNGAGERPASLVFVGSMDWYPNEDGVLHFLEAVLPQVRRQAPGTSLTVVGRNPSARVRAAATLAGVEVTGTVDDVRPYVARSALFVVPLRVGGGTRLKIFEALAQGKAVLSTRIGAEGLPLVPGRHFVQADDPEDFAQAVVSLLRDPARRAELGAAGRELVAQRFSWGQVAREFEQRLEGVMA
jgi:glycosyltransferase involved in cell wall biosynthesis